MFAYNPILDTDSYKTSHWLQYPPGTEVVSSYVATRGGDFPRVLFFGLQAFLKAYWQTPITTAHVDEAAELLEAHGVPFHREGWNELVKSYEGRLPIAIEALPEGTVAPNGTALVQVHNTDARFPWLTSYVETALLRAIWYPSTVATLSWHARRLIGRFLDETGDPAGLPFKLHDFGARGVSSGESAALGAMGHLVNFQGSDTLAGIVAARRYYDSKMAGFSIPAAEHSTITSWGRDGECDAYRNMLTQFARPGKIVACVSDSYDLWKAIDLWGTELRGRIVESGATLVVRPDSGDPVDIVPAAIERLMKHFGRATNAKGYAVLPPCVRLIQGDGVNLGSIQRILEACKTKKLSADNLAFGMGGALLQQVHRDTLKWAMKASAAKIGGTFRDVYKDPITDPGKGSRRGVLAVVNDEGMNMKTVRREELGERTNLLRPVFENGRLLVDDDFETIRARASA